MSAEAKQKGGKTRYPMSDRDCLGRECFAPGMYQHRGATMSGSRNTGSTTPECLSRAYHGCPYVDGKIIAPDEALKKQRKAEGWTIR